MVTICCALAQCGSPSEAGDHAFVNLARHANVVEIVFADQIEFSRLIQIENFAAFDLGSLARLDPKSPSDVVETHVTLRAQPPAVHRVEDAANVVVAEIHEWSHLDRMCQAALENERNVETDDVVTDELVAVRVEILHEVDEILERLVLVLFVAVFVDAKDMLAGFGREAGKLQTRNRTDVKRDR